MNYELTKELKDAGFPQGKGYYINNGGASTMYIAAHVAPQGFVLKPTLEELIEACLPVKADDFGMRLDGDRWHAWYMYHGYFDHLERFKESDGLSNVDLNVFGSTPNEAVALLWLALNKK